MDAVIILAMPPIRVRLQIYVMMSEFTFLYTLSAAKIVLEAFMPF